MSKKILYVVIGLVIVMVVSVVAWRIYQSPIMSSFEACAAKYPVQTSYPEVCRTPAGQSFVNPAQHR